MQGLGVLSRSLQIPNLQNHVPGTILQPREDKESAQGCTSAEEWGQDSGEGCLVPKPTLGRGTGGVYSPKSNENSKIFSTILTRDQVICQLGHVGQVLLLPATVSIPARCSCIPSLLGCGRSQEILLRNPWVDSQPHSGAAMGRMETVIPVLGWAGTHPSHFPSLISQCCVQFHPGRHRGPAS